ncbi:Ribonuclease H [Abeliophyllum distichum]|uniref:Ribonuclease H n=1 Tax=Abeliophyllum distichum TaxID=126358 RepID=A0ABD1TCH3_9LAMI
MMGRKITEAMSNKSSRQQSMVLEEDPFPLEVMTVLLPRDFKQSKMEKYDGSSDPVDHLMSFVDLMRLQATPDAIMCRTFLPTLRREARDWGKDELLKDFIVRFNIATLRIKDLQMSAVVTAMMSETQSRSFKMSLSKNPPDTMYELLKRGKNYVDAEETYLITKSMKDRSEPESNKRKTRDKPEPQNNRGKLTQDETK